jgi:hypothetical protein
MKLSERLKKIESKVPTEQLIRVVKFGAELTKLNYCGDFYSRLENESEKEFVSRVLSIVKQNPKPNGHYLVGNLY